LDDLGQTEQVLVGHSEKLDRQEAALPCSWVKGRKDLDRKAMQVDSLLPTQAKVLQAGLHLDDKLECHVVSLPLLVKFHLPRQLGHRIADCRARHRAVTVSHYQTDHG
jgi:hypothetical protein